jgi:hypothetical protein
MYQLKHARGEGKGISGNDGSGFLMRLNAAVISTEPVISSIHVLVLKDLALGTRIGLLPDG